MKQYRNKKTGEIVTINEEWEEYDESKKSGLYIMILTLSNFIDNEPDENLIDLEDCKQMLAKLKVWQRLKDKGFRFNGWIKEHKKGSADITIASFIDKDYIKANDDLNLLFGGNK